MDGSLSSIVSTLDYLIDQANANLVSRPYLVTRLVGWTTKLQNPANVIYEQPLIQLIRVSFKLNPSRNESSL